MESLESQLGGEFINLDVSESDQEYVRYYLDLLQNKDTQTYEHSLRLAILGPKVARCLGPTMDQRAMLFTGALHDIGKIEIDDEVLKKTEGFSEEDMEKMVAHPIISHLILEKVDLCSAEMALRHHRHQENGYPSEYIINKLSKLTNGEKAKIEYNTLIFSRLDVYDAATNRKNDKYSRILTPEEVRPILIGQNPEVTNEINALYDVGVLGGRKMTVPGIGIVAPEKKDLGISIATTINERPQ
jgi:HD-GYP domain-containing protein (c-di-GMP phosphodiesterase class II)